MNSIKTMLMIAVTTLPFIACSETKPILKPTTEVVAVNNGTQVSEGTTLEANAAVVIPGLSIQVYLPAPAWRSVASGHNFGTNSNNVTAITVPKGIQIKMVLRDNSKPIAATWTSSDPAMTYVWPTTGIEGRLAPIYAGYTTTITAKAADGRSKSFTVYSAGMTADPAPTIGAGARNIVAVRPDGKIVVSGSLLGAGIANATGYAYDTALVPNNTGYVATSCESGADFVVCRTTNPRVVLLAGIDTNMLGQHLEGLTAYELPGPLLDVAAHFYTTVFAALVNGNHYNYSGGMNANGQLANGQPRTTSGRSAITLTGGGLIKLNSSEKISLGYFWNGEAWVSGDYGGFALRDGGAGSSLGWDRANYLDHWQSVTHDENLFCGLGALRTHVLMFGKATGYECGYPGDHFPPRFLAIPNGEIGVRIAKGRGFAVLMTEQNVYYSGMLQLNSAPQCYGWCKVPVPGVPLEIDAKGFTNIIKTTTGVYTIQLGTLRTLNLYPEATNVSFDINPTSVSQLVHSTTRVKVATVGFGANDFTATSSHPDVTLEQILVDGKTLLVHCLRPISSTVTVTLTHNVLPTVKRTFPVTCKDDQAPTAELSVPSTVLPFKDAAFNWKYGDADSSVETARIEVDGNVIWDVYGTPEGSRNHQFSTAATGTHSVCLVVISRGLTTRSCKNIEVSSTTQNPPGPGTTPGSNRRPNLTITQVPASFPDGLVRLQITASDPDGQRLRCTIDVNNDAIVDAGIADCHSGQIRILPKGTGNHLVVMTASDGSLSTTSVTTIYVPTVSNSVPDSALATSIYQLLNKVGTFGLCTYGVISNDPISGNLIKLHQTVDGLNSAGKFVELRLLYEGLKVYFDEMNVFHGQVLDFWYLQFRREAWARAFAWSMTKEAKYFRSFKAFESLANLSKNSIKFEVLFSKGLSRYLAADLANEIVRCWDPDLVPEGLFPTMVFARDLVIITIRFAGSVSSNTLLPLLVIPSTLLPNVVVEI